MDTERPAVRRLSTLDTAQLMPLRDEAHAQGFRFLDTLIAEWESGINRFDKPGEALFAVYQSGRLIGIGGLNRAPYAQGQPTGRVRRVYVLAEARRRGIGKLLLEAIVDEARKHFPLLTLRTDTDEGAAFYEALQFSPTDGDDATHALPL